MVLDILSEMQSPTLSRLPEIIGVKQMVAVAFYFTPRLSDTEMTRDNSRTVTQILRTLNEWVIRSDQAKNSKNIEDLAAASYPYLLVQILWFLDTDMVIWKEAAVCAFYYFRLQGETELESASKYLLHIRRTAEELDPNAKIYRKGEWAEMQTTGCISSEPKKKKKKMQLWSKIQESLPNRLMDQEIRSGKLCFFLD